MKIIIPTSSLFIFFLLFTFFTLVGQDKKLSGFIVTDAHFGWLGAKQPSLEEQKEAMNVIMNRFPQLDVFMDTGDAHHDYALDDARGDWTDIIQGGCRTSPFFFVVGNHENHNSLTVDNKYFDYDSEYRSNVLGSVECQPYYSFDMKGIHFISLPQLMDQAYVSEAAIAWLKLDLDIHKNKTTIILSHNSLKGTTEYFSDIGYRQVSNSEILLDLFKKYPQVIAWMHGHNHTYEVVPIAGTVYVSNGRIGGFDPTNKKVFNGNYGAGNLGGIYFEVTDKSFTVRSFSATQNKFFDEMTDGEHLSYILNRPTTFDASALPEVSYGFGGSPHGQKINAYRHHVGGKRALYITGAENPVINENSKFSVFTQRTASNWQTKHLSGYSFEPNEENNVKNDQSWEWLNPGVRILKRQNAKSTKGIFSPGATLGQRSYYRCAPGQKYRLTYVIDAGKGGQAVTPEFRLFEKHFVRIYDKKGNIVKLPAGKSTFSWDFDIPSLDNIASVYSDRDSDNDFMLTTGLVFSNVISDIDILSFKLTLANAVDDDVTSDAVITVDADQITTKGNIKAGDIRRFDITTLPDYRTTYGFDLKGNKRITWIEKQTAPKFQVRNANAKYANNKLIIGPLRNHFSNREEVVIVPMSEYNMPYVHRIRHAENVTITEATVYKPEILLEVGALWIHDQAEVDIICSHAPKKVEGTERYQYDNGKLTLHIERESTYKIIW